MRYFEHIKRANLAAAGSIPANLQRFKTGTRADRRHAVCQPKGVTHWCYGNLVETLARRNGNDEDHQHPAASAGDTCEKVGFSFGKLGEPFGVATYKPYNASGEMYLHHTFGMIGCRWTSFRNSRTGRDDSPDGSGESPTPGSSARSGSTERRQDGRRHLRPVPGRSGARGIEKIVEAEYTGRTVPVNKFTIGKSWIRAVGITPRTATFRSGAGLRLVDAEEIAQGVYKDNNRYSLLLQVRGLRKAVLHPHHSEVSTISTTFRSRFSPRSAASLMGDIRCISTARRRSACSRTPTTPSSRVLSAYAARGSIVIKKPGAKLINW